MRPKTLLMILGLICPMFAMAQPEASYNKSASEDIYYMNARLSPAINIGNALEAPFEGAWGISLEEAYFRLIKNAGFQTIRLPVSWGHHTSKSAPYTIEQDFLGRVDWAVEQALKHDLNIIINVHHDDRLNRQPLRERARFLATWTQLAKHYQYAPKNVYFELLNEPHDAFNEQPELWNSLLAEAILLIRQTNPERPVIVGPVGWNAISRLADLRLPDDANLIVTVHFYEPFDFTHQGADWVSPIPATGRGWTGDAMQLAWDNWSWDTDLQWLKDEQHGTVLGVHYRQGWAGLYLHRDNHLEDVRRLSFATDQQVALEIDCGQTVIPIVTQDAWQTTIVDIRSCGSLGDLKIKNRSPEALNPFLLKDLRLHTGSEAHNLFRTEKDVITEALEYAHSWGQANGHPIFIGEFGAYGEADMDSRLRWTTFVREEFERLDFSWAYWEFAAGFGVYNPVTGTWREDLLKTLIP